MPLHVGVDPALVQLPSIRTAYGTTEPQLQARLNIALAALAAVANMQIFDVAIGGAGDGQAWEVLLSGAVLAQVPAGLVVANPDNSTIRAIVTSSEGAMQVAIANYLNALPANSFIRKIVIDGGGAGAQWCAVILTEVVPPPPP